MEAAPAATDLPASPGITATAARARRTRAFRVAVDLCRARLAASRSGRFARGAALAIVALGFVIALSIRAVDGPAAPIGGLLRKTAIALAWISGGVLALAAAKDTSLTDRADGVEALVAARGVGASLLRAARGLGATAQIVRTIGLPLAALALGTAALAADVPSAIRRVLAALLLFAWALVAGVTLGALAALSARLFGARGKGALVTIVIGERVIAGAFGLAAWSIPGALEAALSIVLGATGVGGGG